MGLGSSRSINIQINEYLRNISDSSTYKTSFVGFKENFNSRLNDGTIKLYEHENSPFIPSFHWYSCSLENYFSTGEGFNKNKAIIRSLGELYERIPIFLELNEGFRIKEQSFSPQKVVPLRDSNGLSFGLNLNDALFRSYKELVERHVVLDYWGRKKETQPIKSHNKFSFFSFLYKHKVDIDCRFLLLNNDFGFKVVVCNLYRKDRPPYNIFGYGSDEVLDLSVEKAFLEAWRFFWNFEIQKESARFGPPKDVINCADHFNFYCYNKIDPNDVFSEGRSTPSIGTSELKIDDILFFDLNKIGYAGYSLKVARTDFHIFESGVLNHDFLQRSVGEVHPIA